MAARRRAAGRGRRRGRPAGLRGGDVIGSQSGGRGAGARPGGSSCAAVTGGGGRAARPPRQRPPQDGLRAGGPGAGAAGAVRSARAAIWLVGLPARTAAAGNCLQENNNETAERPESVPSSGKATNTSVTPDLPCHRIRELHLRVGAHHSPAPLPPKLPAEDRERSQVPMAQMHCFHKQSYLHNL